MIHFGEKRWRNRPLMGAGGAVVVEFALTLLFLFFLFIAFVQVVEIIVAQERLSLAAFVASRVYAVQGRGAAADVANAIESGITIRTGSRTITLEKEIALPINLRNIAMEAGAKLKISTRVKTFVEPDLGGDN